ncbi:hypothetical protein DIS24_g5939 [Lasiodiplodia hormozganensis]|uniref:Uncharacterized protein n=1 Tax=Lasiodiplodia hormozganensis TaxID=869390 RepID=A0AA40CWS3_9PEZI|nr:hypothetical protein DIS24_g5939 [Lasiodiplodia hormozganensis]
MATAKKRKLDSISDGPAPSEPEAKRHHTTNRCRLTELPDELLILIAEHLAGFDDPITYVHRRDGKLIIEHPKAYRDISLVGLRDLSDTLCVEFEKALHRNGIVTFEDQHAFAEYFDPEMLNSHPRAKSIRLATQYMRLNICNIKCSEKAISVIEQLPIKLKKIHLGGAWKYKDGPLMFTPTEANVSFFQHQALHLIIHFSPWPLEHQYLRPTFGPGRFGYNTVFHSESDQGICDLWDSGADEEVNYATFDDLLATWNEDQSTLGCTGSIVSMDGATLSSITQHIDSFLHEHEKENETWESPEMS